MEAQWNLLSTVLQKSCICFPTFKPKINTQSSTISFTAEVLAAIRHTGITVKHLIATSYIQQKAVVTASNLYTGKKSVWPHSILQWIFSDCDTINIPGTCRYFTGMIIHISGKHGIVGGNRFIKANTVSAYQFCGNHLSPGYVVTVFQNFKVHVLRYFPVMDLAWRNRSQCIRIDCFRTERNQVVVRIPVSIQYVQEAGQKEIIGIRKYQPSAFGSGKSAITGITGSSALLVKRISTSALSLPGNEQSPQHPENCHHLPR